MTSNVFREYDIRGIIGKEILIEETADLTKAIFSYFFAQQPTLSTVVIGMDGRTHSSKIKDFAVQAALNMGLNVIDIGLCATPTFYFSLFNSPATSGIMITASHNPKEYNGIKICLEKKSVWGTQIQEIRQIYQSKNFYHNSSVNIGSISQYNATDNYITWLVDHFTHLKNLSIDALIDCGNGTAGPIFEKLIPAMGWTNVELLFAPVDGTFPNHEADPTNPKNMLHVKKLLTQNTNFSIGLGLDGDCDRMNPMTKRGILVPGDQLLALYSKKIVAQFPRAPIVFDIKSSSTLIQVLEKMGAIPCMAPSGHSIIKEHLRKHNAKLAGELSCHFFFNDRYFGYDDGIYAALRLFELLHDSKENLDQLIAKLPHQKSTPEYRIPCHEHEKNNIVSHVNNIFCARTDMNLITIDGVRAQADYGWGLIRASNTQPVLCLRFESPTLKGLNHIKQDFKQALQPYFDEKKLKEYFEE